MLFLHSLLLITAVVTLVSAKKHHLFVGNLRPPALIHALEFDDETLTLTKTKSIQADASHAWIAFDHEKQNVYGASLNEARFGSYSILDPSSLRLDKSVQASSQCQKTSAFILPTPDGDVYSAAWPGPNACGLSLSTLLNGTLDKVTSTWQYSSESGIHGLASDPSYTLLYSADLNGNSIWTHSIKRNGTQPTRLLNRFKLAKADRHPRHLVAHPGGKYLHVLMEAANELGQFSLDESTGIPIKETATYSLIPRGLNNSGYWSAEVMLSPSKKYLWATARAQSNTTNYGYISCFRLKEDGAIESKLFTVPTTTTGGIANAVSPAFFSDEWVAMADYGIGYVQMWRFKDGTNPTAKAVARVDIGEGGCCANAIWYD